MEILYLILGILIFFYIYDRWKKYKNKKEAGGVQKRQNDEEPITPLPSTNHIHDPERETEKKQYEQIEKARWLINDSNYSEAIAILENIMFKEGYQCLNQSNPLMLLRAYYDNQMYEKAWQYINFLSDDYPTIERKIKEYRILISTAEGRHKDALRYSLWQVVGDEINSTPEYRKSEDKLLKAIRPKIKKAGLAENQDHIMEVVFKLIETDEKNYQIIIEQMLRSLIQEKPPV